MKSALILFAFALLSFDLRAGNGSFSEELYRAKYGRPTPAAAARERAAKAELTQHYSQCHTHCDAACCR